MFKMSWLPKSSSNAVIVAEIYFHGWVGCGRLEKVEKNQPQLSLAAAAAEIELGWAWQKFAVSKSLGLGVTENLSLKKVSVLTISLE